MKKSPIFGKKLLPNVSCSEKALGGKLGQTTKFFFVWIIGYRKSVSQTLSIFKKIKSIFLSLWLRLSAQTTHEIVQNQCTFLPPQIITKVKGIPLPHNAIPNVPNWGPSTSENFTTKSANWLAHDIPHAPPWPFKWLWKLKTPPKLRMSQICQNSLSVRDVLFSRHIVPSNLCALCQNGPETIDHLFFHCPPLDIFGIQLKQKIGLKLNPSVPSV